jgi:putative iron-only hydrogenase system regulator
MNNKKHLGVISILVKDRQSNAPDVQRILTENGHCILARMGVNVQRSCVENCTGLITVTVEGTAEEIKALNGKIDGLYGIVAKYNILTD